MHPPRSPPHFPHNLPHLKPKPPHTTSVLIDEPLAIPLRIYRSTEEHAFVAGGFLGLAYAAWLLFPLSAVGFEKEERGGERGKGRGKRGEGKGDTHLDFFNRLATGGFEV